MGRVFGWLEAWTVNHRRHKEMLVVGKKKKKKIVIENMTDDLKYPQEWQLKERLGFNLMSPRIKIRNHRNTERKH